MNTLLPFLHIIFVILFHPILSLYQVTWFMSTTVARKLIGKNHTV